MKGPNTAGAGAIAPIPGPNRGGPGRGSLTETTLPILSPSGSTAPKISPTPLADGYGREVRYLRLSVTDRCDLRCVYCMPEEGNPMSSKPEILSVEETIRAAGIFRMLGVRTVRLTGGEPLVRRGLIEIVRGIRHHLGIEDLALSTNASLLREMAEPLRDAGVRRVNISLDTLRPERLAPLSRRGDLGRILSGIDAAVEVGFEERKLNTVALRGLNEDELGNIVDFAWERGFTPRFIELMPVGEGAQLYPQHHLAVNDIIARLGDRVEVGPQERPTGRGPARYLRSARDPGQKVGFISAISDNFCDGCNRVRVSPRGELRPCLASPRGVSLRDLMRAGADDTTIAAAVRQALAGKDLGHRFREEDVRDHHLVTMSGIGG